MKALHHTVVHAPAEPAASIGHRLSMERLDAAAPGDDQAPPRLPLSVVIPMMNEAGNVEALLDEVARALDGRIDYEVICIDDGSDDDTLSMLQSARRRHARLRVLRHLQCCGQSTAIRTGVKAACGDWIATLDGDGQNDPADILKLIALREESAAEVRLFAGWRVQRQDSGGKRWASRWANALRRRLLRDDTPDTGCGIKLFQREAFLDLPSFDHMHRYLPALMQRAGWRTLSIPVSHRPRQAGRSKYGNLSRALVGIADLRGVAWLMRRRCVARFEELP